MSYSFAELKTSISITFFKMFMLKTASCNGEANKGKQWRGTWHRDKEQGWPNPHIHWPHPLIQTSARHRPSIFGPSTYQKKNCQNSLHKYNQKSAWQHRKWTFNVSILTIRISRWPVETMLEWFGQYHGWAVASNLWITAKRL